MKGIIVEINNNDAIILTNDGLFEKVKNHNYTVGQAITIQESRKTYSKLIAGAASMAAAFAVCTIGAYAWFTPTDYVSLDVNPSLEYSLNTFDRILEVEGVTDDGEELLDGLDLKNMKIQEAVKETLDKLIADGYLTDDPNGGVVITTSNDKRGDAEQLAAELEKEVQTYLDEQDGITAKVDAEAVAPERVEEAKELGVTPGKLNLVEKLQESTTETIHAEEWLAKPVKEINKAIKENRKAEKDSGKSIDKDDQEEAVTEDGIELNGKPEKKDKERPNGKEKTDDRDGATSGGVRWNDQGTMEDNDRSSEKIDRGPDWKINQQETGEDKTNEPGNGNKKQPKNSGHQKNDNSSDWEDHNN